MRWCTKKRLRLRLKLRLGLTTNNTLVLLLVVVCLHTAWLINDRAKVNVVLVVLLVIRHS